MSDLRTILGFFSPMRLRLAMAGLCGAGAYISAIGLIGVSGWLISHASQMPPVLTLSVAIVMVRAFGLGRAVFRYAERLVAHDAVLRSLVELRAKLYESLAAAPVSAIIAMRRANTLTSLVRDVDEVQYLPLRGLVPVAGATLAAAVCVAVEFWVDLGAGSWVLAGWVTSATVVPYFSWRWARSAAGSVADDSAVLAAEAVDLIDGSADIATLGLSGTAMAVVADTDGRITRANVGYASRSASITAALQALQGVMIVGAAWSMLRAVDAGAANPVLLPTAVFIPLAMGELLSAYPNAALTLVAVEPSVARLAAMVSGRQPGENKIETRNRGGGGNLYVEAGERLALTGSSGSGKTTALMRMAGLLREASMGFSVAGGEPQLAAVGRRGRLRSALAEQQAQIFATSIAENLQLARPLSSPPLTDDQLWAALRAAQLEDWVRSSPLGLDTMVGISGARMSGGQRQRLSLARLFVADSDIWLVDEPTAQVDAETAARLLQSLREATEGRTLVVASHDERDIAICTRQISLEADSADSYTAPLQGGSSVGRATDS